MSAPSIKDRGQRHFQAEWKLDDTHYAVLSCIHSRDRKAFFASLYQEQEERGDGYSVRSHMLFERERIAAERVARYSAKAMRDFVARAVAEVERRRGEPGVDRYFTATELPD